MSIACTRGPLYATTSAASDTSNEALIQSIAAGDQVAVGRSTLNEDRDWPVLTEYRALFGGLFKRLYGLDEARLGAVLPRVRAQDIGLV